MMPPRYWIGLAASQGWTPANANEARVAVHLHRLHCRPADTRQQHRLGRWRLDFAWPAVQLALEVDGFPHRSVDGVLRDALRDRDLARSGWVVVRVPVDVMTDDELADYLARVVRMARA